MGGILTTSTFIERFLLCAGPYFKKNYVSHTNASLPGLLKTMFRILRLPLSLFDATASDLADTFTTTPGFHSLHGCCRSTSACSIPPGSAESGPLNPYLLGGDPRLQRSAGKIDGDILRLPSAAS